MVHTLSRSSNTGRQAPPAPRAVGNGRRFSMYSARRQDMLRLKTVKTMTRGLMRVVFVAILTALIGFGATDLAAQGQRLWSIVIHFQYQDGFEFDYVLERGVSSSELGAALAECGRSHRTGSVVRYH